jgi:enoyl-CoA hydratase
MPVQYALDGAVATITLDDGKANAISAAVVGELDAALDQARADAARALVIAGRPGRFSAGFDLAAMTSSHESMKALVMGGGRLVARLLLEPRPVVVACTGHALAAGGLILLAADHRIGAAGDFKIGLNEVAIGLPMPRWGVELASYRLAPNRLAWNLVLGQVGGPEDAVTSGFLDAVVPPERVVEEATGLAVRLSELRTGAVEGTKLRARQALVDRMLDGMEDDLESVRLPG